MAKLTAKRPAYAKARPGKQQAKASLSPAEKARVVAKANRILSGKGG